MNRTALCASCGLGVAVVLVVLGLGHLSPAQADDKEFSNHDLRGSWGLIGLGAKMVGTVQETGGVVGRMTFDGDGNGTSANYHNWVVSGPGVLEEREFTYEVAADGTGVVYGGSSGTDVIYRFILVDNKKEMYLIDMREHNVRARIAKKQ